MKTNPNRALALVLIISCIFLSAAIPYFAKFGLDKPEPIGEFLNFNFPTRVQEGLTHVPVYPNLTFQSPLTFSEVPEGEKLIIGQRNGTIFWFDKVPGVNTKQVVVDLSDKVGVVWDGGFLGLALHPRFGEPGFNFMYTFYTTKDVNGNDYPDRPLAMGCNEQEYFGNFLILSRFDIDPNTLVANRASENIMLKLRMYGSTHRGGALLFGNDGYLYLSTGDQTAARKSQDISRNLDGGVLRLDVDVNNRTSHPPLRKMPENLGFNDEITGEGYFIPNDNPFLDPSGASFEEYFSIGHRNPHRMTIDRETEKIYIGEVGGGLHEEINILSKGKNFGWPLYEGLARNASCVPNLLNNMAHEEPFVAFPRQEANALIGGFVYRGSDIPELEGRYICADYGIGEEIWSVDTETGAYEQYGNFTSSDIISFGEDNDNEVYIMKYGVSTLFKLVPKTGLNAAIPKWLSQTGAFENLIDLKPVKGLVPYELIESFWSDGALKKRWMAIPNDGLHDTEGEQIAYSEDGDWDFPIGSVLIKHFEFPIDENNTDMTKRLETRFSVKGEDGKFYYLTYKWNDEQTDAMLLNEAENDIIAITESDGSTRSQTWRYPNTAECVACHNEASKGSLGTRSRYLNSDYTYASTGQRANQLVTLSHLGILNRDIDDTQTANILTYKAINDPDASLDEKARSYMDLNCAYCHRSDAGNRADFDLRLNLSLAQTGLLLANANETLGIPNEKIVDPGSSDTSILFHRMNDVRPGITMPPLAKNRIDELGVNLIKAWIDELNPITDEPIVKDGIYKIENVLNGNVLTIANAGLGNAVNTQTEPNTEANNQHFEVKKSKPGFFTIKAEHSEKLVDVTASGQAPGTNVWQYTPNGTDAQEWELISAENGFVQIRSKANGLYLEASNTAQGGIDNVTVDTRDYQDGQLWKFSAISNTPLPCGDDLQDITDSVTNPAITARAEINETENRFRAFDNRQTRTDFSKWLDNGGVPTVENPSYIDFSFDRPERITGLVLVSGNDYDQRDPQHFSVLGSNGDGFETLDTWSNENFSQRFQARTFSFTNTKTYSTYRLIITKNKGNVSMTQIAEIEFLSCTTETSPTEISLSENEIELHVSDMAQLFATISPDSAANDVVKWSSDNPLVATVDAQGNITALEPGTANITATMADGSANAVATVNVKRKVSIGCNGSSININGDSRHRNGYCAGRNKFGRKSV